MISRLPGSDRIIRLQINLSSQAFSSALLLAGACHDIFAGREIERRPRGASRMNPLPHWLQRAYV
jgi:hypothetical protein